MAEPAEKLSADDVGDDGEARRAADKRELVSMDLGAEDGGAGDD